MLRDDGRPDGAGLPFECSVTVLAPCPESDPRLSLTVSVSVPSELLRCGCPPDRPRMGRGAGDNDAREAVGRAGADVMNEDSLAVGELKFVAGAGPVGELDNVRLAAAVAGDDDDPVRLHGGRNAIAPKLAQQEQRTGPFLGGVRLRPDEEALAGRATLLRTTTLIRGVLLSPVRGHLAQEDDGTVTVAFFCPRCSIEV
jgi:hypothetical protein